MSHVESNLGERAPLLQVPSSSSEHKRIHFLDNLRLTLFLLLVAQHATQETVRIRSDIERFQLVLLSLFSATNKSCLWTTFFLVSGCSTTLALGGYSKCADATNTVPVPCNQATINEDTQHSSRDRIKPEEQAHSDKIYCFHYTRHTLFPALRYMIFLHPLLCIGLRPWGKIFESDRDPSRLSGPVLYILLLSLMVYSHLLVRRTKRLWSTTTRSTGEHESTFPKHFLASGVACTILLLVYTFISCTNSSSTLEPLEPLLVFVQYDTIAPDAPFSYILAYILGVYLPSIIPFITADAPHRLPRLILSEPSYPWLCLASSLTASWASMAVAQHILPPLFEHIRIWQRYGRQVFPSGGFNAHTTFFVLWQTFNTLFIPLFTFLAFASSSFTQQPLVSRHFIGKTLAKRMAILPYMHMITVLIAVHYLKGLNPIVPICALISVVGLLLALPVVRCWPGVGYICRNWLFAMPAMVWKFWRCRQRGQ